MNKLIITKHNGRILTAMIHDGLPVELNLDDSSSVLGNIYIGKVKNIVKNLNSAFVDFREGGTGYYSLTENPISIYPTPSSGPLKVGDEIVVQVANDALKTKDPVLTANLNFTGKYVVLTSGKAVIGFSSKIGDREWKEEIRPELEALTKGTIGLIVRTNAYRADREVLLQEIRRLITEYEKVLADAPYRTCYSLLYQAQAAHIKSINGCPEGTLESIVTDDPEVYGQLSDYIRLYMPESHEKLSYYEDSLLPLLQLHRLDTTMEQACQKRVWLKSGGYLVIEQTEAMVVIDVNTGKYAGKKTLADTIRKINLEAAEEICRQLRLRNLSGIIMVDFIDMKAEEDRQLLMETLRRFAAKDPIKTSVIDMTALNLVELTRKKGKKSWLEQMRHGKESDH